MDRDRKLYLAKLCAVVAAYYVAAKLGLTLAFATPSVTAIWAPTGIALAALILWGYRMWPAVAVGAFLANSWTGVPLLAVAGIAAGNTLEALTGAYLLLAVAKFRPSLERVRDVVALAVLGGMVATTVSATIGTGSLVAADQVAAGELGTVWRTWWLGDMGGALVVASTLMVAATHWSYRRIPGGAVEAALLALAVGAVTAFVFSADVSLTFLIFPPLIWAAMRFWQPGAVGASLLVAAIAIPLTERDLGPFAGSSPDDRLLLAQTFVGVTGIGTLLLAAVMTERRRAEVAVERIADTLQRSLLPEHLPDVPGIDVAAYFRPAGEGHLVGGDFYDLFESGDGAWAAVIGDVVGKGAPAAALTGLARHTIRAAAADERRPSRILKRLNDAILHHSPDGLCTVACVRLEPGPDGVRAVLASGGHPLPLLLRASGAVEEIGSPGTLLGAIPGPELADHWGELGPGDTLVLYTDGLTDAWAPARIMKRAQLVSVLEACATEATPRIVEALRGAWLQVDGEPRDDIAVLVLRVEPRPEARAASRSAASIA